VYLSLPNKKLGETGFQNPPEKKELLPIDFSGVLGYILDNGSGDLNFNFGTIPIIKLYLQKLPQSSSQPEKKGGFF
jgi:hypothetical protein